MKIAVAFTFTGAVWGHPLFLINNNGWTAHRTRPRWMRIKGHCRRRLRTTRSELCCRRSRSIRSSGAAIQQHAGKWRLPAGEWCLVVVVAAIERLAGGCLRDPYVVRQRSITIHAIDVVWCRARRRRARRYTGRSKESRELHAADRSIHAPSLTLPGVRELFIYIFFLSKEAFHLYLWLKVLFVNLL